MTRRPWRVPALVLLPLLVVAGLAFQDGGTPSGSSDPAATRLDRLAPVGPAADAEGSTWYCAAGLATGVVSGASGGIAEQVVTVANLSSADITALVTAYPEGAAPVGTSRSVPANGRVEVRVSDLAVAPWAAVVVEATGTDVAVDHEVRGPGGRSVSPCASHPSATWYFPAGTTRAGTRSFLALFNPFPGEASVDLAFETEDGARTPQQFQGLVVPGGGVTVVDIGAVVTLRAEIATTVTARNGRIIAESLMVSDGTDDTPVGLTAVLGAPGPSPTWVLPDTGAPAEGTSVRVAVMNPGDTEAEVEVQVFLDDPATNGTVEPFALTIDPGRYASVEVFADGRVPAGVDSWILVRSLDGVPVVAQRLAGGLPESSAPGFVATLGSPVVATRWNLPVAATGTVTGSSLSLVNPSADTDVTVRLVAHAGGGQRALPGFAEVVVPAGSQVLVDLGPDGLGLAGLAISVTADGPVVAARRFLFAERDLAASMAIPVAGTESLPVRLAEPDQFLVDAPVVTDPTIEGAN